MDEKIHANTLSNVLAV